MSLDETLGSIESGQTLELATISYAESVAARVPVAEFDLPDPTDEELAASRAALRSRGWLDDQGTPAGPLLTFAGLGARPGCRTWFWESSGGPALILLVLKRNAAGLAMPDPTRRGVHTLSLRPVESLVSMVASDAWQTPRTSLTAADMHGRMLPVTLDRNGKKPTLTAPKSLDEPPTGRGRRHKIPMRRSTADQAGFARAVAAAFDNVLWGLYETDREFAWSLT